MNLQSMRRRIDALEAEAPPLIKYPPLTREEIADLLERSSTQQPWTKIERERVIQQCPFVQGECRVDVGSNGKIWIRRYGGIDIERLNADDLGE